MCSLHRRGPVNGGEWGGVRSAYVSIIAQDLTAIVVVNPRVLWTWVEIHRAADCLML